MKNIIEAIGWLLGRLFPTPLILKFSAIRNIFYTAIVCSRLGRVGKRILIMYKVYILGAQHITVGNDFYCYWGVRIEAYNQHNGVKFNPRIIIGNNVSINPHCHIGAINKVELQDGVLLASKVFITDHFHGSTTYNDLKIAPRFRVLYSKGEVVIKKNAWIGEGVAIMPGVTIGENSIIGANSVVTKDIPDNAIAVGVPAKVIKQL